MRKWLSRLVLASVVLVVAALLALYLLMRGSLPQLDGDSALIGLAAPVSVQRDQLGVVTIDATARSMPCARSAMCTRRSAISRWI